MSWKVTTPPEFEPVSLADAKAYLRVQHSAEDDLIEQIISAARDYCEQELDLAIMDQEITLKLDAFPRNRVICLPRANLIEVVSFDYLDSAGDSQPFTDYTEDSFQTPARLVNNTGTWPEILDNAGSITIVYRAGYGPDQTSGGYPPPGSILQAMRMLITHWYDNRNAVMIGATPAELQLAVASCLHKHRRLGV